jgi:hypothetical protein
MNDEENFIARWSRLKREAAEGEKARTEAPSQQQHEARAEQADKEMPAAPVNARPGPELPFDPATLPPVDSIVAGSDIRAFLQKGVPAELTKAALRRAWTADPAIRDFIGIAENQWDFTDPTAIPGFGPLEATGELPRLVAQAMGELPDAAETIGPSEQTGAVLGAEPCESPVRPEQEQSADHATPDAAEQASQDVAAQHQNSSGPSVAGPRDKGHGGALPR